MSETVQAAEQALETAVAAATTTQPLTAATLDAIMSKWTVECVFGTLLSRDTDALNYLRSSALPELRRRLLSET